MVPARAQKNVPSRLALTALLLALLGAGAMAYYYLGLFTPRVLAANQAKNLAGGYSFGADFYPVWLTSHEAMHNRRDPYSDEMTREIQKGLFGRPLDLQIATDPPAAYRTFAYPAFADVLFWPAAELPFSVARLVLVMMLAVGTAASVLLWLRALQWKLNVVWMTVIFLMVLGSYPVLEGLYVDQLGLAVGFFLAAAMFCLQRERLFFAGVLLALTTIKPQMALLAILYLLLWSLQDWRRRKQLCFGLISTSAVLVGAGLIASPHWIVEWLRVVLGYHRYARPPLVGEVLAAPFGMGLAPLVTLLLIALLVLAAVWIAWRNRAADLNSTSFWLTLSLLLCITSVTLLPGQATHDQVILLPGIFLLASRWREIWANWISRAILLTAAAVLLWPWVSSLTLIAMQPLINHDVFYSKAVFVLPLRTAAVFPFVVLGALVPNIRRLRAGNGIF
jgi:hypothetical protein